MPEIEKKYGRNSNQYKILENRVKMTCKLQNAQIDKAKIGKKVKGIPKIWTDRKYIDEKYGKNTKESNMYKELLLDRHPYFFIHLYSKTKAKYKKFIDEYDGSSYNKFGLGIFELINLENKTKEQQEYIDLFNEYMPVIFNECVMNNICRYLENVGKDIKQYFKTENCNSYYELFLDDIELDKKILNECNIEYKKFKKNIINDLSLNYNNNKKYLNKIKTNKSSLFYDKFTFMLLYYNQFILYFLFFINANLVNLIKN